MLRGWPGGDPNKNKMNFEKLKTNQNIWIFLL